ncbi:MAG: hypothetical protein H7256_08260 [Bdellovibrio sp.]|nr:hypothetical protein [Bdellovibrio sp.]
MQLTDSQIHYLKQHWPLTGEIKFHRRVANIVYFTTLNGNEVILRLTEPTHRKFKEIESELDWLNFLHANGMRVANPIATIQNEFVVEIPGPLKFFAVVSIHKNVYEGNRHVDKEKTYETFLEGYNLENQLDSIWIKR